MTLDYFIFKFPFYIDCLSFMTSYVRIPKAFVFALSKKSLNANFFISSSKHCVVLVSKGYLDSTDNALNGVPEINI